jgi:hypothetical protein
MNLGGSFSLDLAFTWYDEVNVPPLGAPGAPVQGVSELQVLPFDVGVRYTFTTGSIVRPYVGGGLSYFAIDAEGARTDDEVGYYVLGGLLVGRERGLNLMVDVLWREAEGTLHVDTDDGIDASISNDIDFGGFGANVGVMFTW